MKKLSEILNLSNLTRPINDFNKRPGKLSEGMNFLKFIENWENIVGERLAKYTIPLKHKDSILVVLTNHPTFAQQISFMEPMLIKKIEKCHPQLKNKIKKITYQHNDSFFEQQKKVISNKKVESKENHWQPKNHRHSPEFQKLSREAEIQFENIEDIELKKQLINIYIQMKNS